MAISTERTIIGDERVAQIHEERGNVLHAALHRLTPTEAFYTLLWLSGCPEQLAEAMDKGRRALGVDFQAELNAPVANA